MMKKFPLISLYFFTLLIISSCNSGEQISTNPKPYVVILSMDGFRWDYPDKANTPNLDYVAAHGVKAKSLRPSFPTVTFPNHYSIATGLYPDHHGIVLNNFYDPDTKQYYYFMKRESVEDPDFYGGEPIWVTAEKQGIKTASFYWVGSEAPIKGMYPSIWKKYHSDVSFEQRLDSVIAWLQLPQKTRPHLILWYMSEPDHQGHSTGPDSPEIVEKVEYLDSLLGVFLMKLDQLPVKDSVNFIITSDHGMCNTSKDRNIVLDDYINRGLLDVIIGYGPNYNLKVKEGMLDSAFHILSSVPHITCWKSSQVPERFHYGNNPRDLYHIRVRHLRLPYRLFV